MKKIVLALAGCAFLFASCEKAEEDKQPIDVSKTKFLMEGAWQLKAYTIVADISDPASPPIDAYAPIPACVKDDYLAFHSPNEVTEYAGDMKCPQSPGQDEQPDYLSFFYSLTNDDQHLTIWSNPDDPDNSIRMVGEMKYPSINVFEISYVLPNAQNGDLSSRHTLTYVRIY